MSKSEILYVKRMNSESDGDEGEQDIWDDRKINDAYDKAMKVANAEVAKRLAMATNSQHQEKEAAKKKKSKPSSRQNCTKQADLWKVGMPCRAIYKEDSSEYEAVVARIINEKECVVQFLGYDNLEIVLISSLKPSLGQGERQLQIEIAAAETGESVASHSPHGRSMDVESQRPASPGSTETFQKKKKSSKKKNHYRMPTKHFDLPDVSMPNLNMLRNMGTFEMPLPPPPSMPHGSGADTEDQAVSSMLLSWYMSGYYTGLYQGLKRAKENRRNN